MREFKELFKSGGIRKTHEIADFYHANSNLDASNLKPFTQSIRQTEDHFPHAKKITLPPLNSFLPVPFHRLLIKRRSTRMFTDQEISLKQIARLLRLSYGKIQSKETLCSTVPSAGGLFPLHVYLLSSKTELDPGIYHYYFISEWLDQIAPVPDIKNRMQNILLKNPIQGTPALYLCITADLKEVCAKYGERGYRFALLEAGHLAQNIMLVTESMKLGSLALGGYQDTLLAQAIGIDNDEEKVVYLIAIGKKS